MKNPYLYLLKTAWKYAGDQRRKFVLIYTLLITASVILTMHPVLYGWFIGKLQQQPDKIIYFAWIFAASFLGLKLAEWAFHGPARVMERKLAFTIGHNYLGDLYHKVLHLPVGWHQENHSGSTINRLRKGYEALRNFYQTGFAYLQAIGKLVFAFAAMIWFSPLFGLIGVLLGSFTVWVILKFDKPYIQSIRDCNEKEHKVYSTLFDSLSNIVTVITLRLEKRMEKILSSRIMEVLPFWKKKVLINECKWFVVQMLVGLIYVVVILGFIYQNYEPGQVLLIGGLVTLLGYVTQFTGVFNDVANLYTQLIQYKADIDAVEKLEKSYYEEHRQENSISLPNKWETISIKNLNFDRNKVSLLEPKQGNLHKVCLEIKRGKKIAIIGESGSGKSTLLALLRGLYKPSAGAQLNADNNQEVSFDSICNSVTLFPQDPEIFENSILYNITLGLPVSDEEIEKVIESVHFADVVRGLPNGLHSHIQEKGVNLSGGQKQRLALARGVLAARTSSIVLFDEPTSSVDPRTEMRIYQQLFSLFQDKAIISTLHRLHLLPAFDYIYIMKEGSVEAEGTFEDLLTHNLLFQELWQHQKEQGNSVMSL